MARSPGVVRDAIITFLAEQKNPVTIAEIRNAIAKQLGEVPPSSVRSYLNLNCPALFERTGRGEYRLNKQVK
ncbi:hypothetical protein [Nitrobacter sp. TKz-YC01]|uniref:hypothetical protein n=1 Tax=Nitrobacter sp. TKz-YC01 TaxID=3398703 RepID=UPI003A0FF211